MSSTTTVYVDAHGGDRAPKVVVQGAVMAAPEINARIVLCGDESKISRFLDVAARKSNLTASEAACKIRIQHCSEKIEMDENPVTAVRQKKDSSMNVGLRLTAKDPQAAFVTAGNSGAAMAAAILHLKKIPGVERPSIGAYLPTETGKLLLVDAGANTVCRASQLVQFGLLGSAYYQHYFPERKGNIGVLSNGHEDSKGNDLTRATNELLKQLKEKHLIDADKYIGYVEGSNLFNGHVDVVVCDGFTGNLVLKTLEGMASALTSILKQEAKKNMLAYLGFAFAYGALKNMKRRTDYEEIGGAPLIGVNGHAFISHGKSNAKAIKNAILHASRFADDRELMPKLRETIAATKLPESSQLPESGE